MGYARSLDSWAWPGMLSDSKSKILRNTWWPTWPLWSWKTFRKTSHIAGSGWKSIDGWMSKCVGCWRRALISACCLNSSAAIVNLPLLLLLLPWIATWRTLAPTFHWQKYKYKSCTCAAYIYILRCPPRPLQLPRWSLRYMPQKGETIRVLTWKSGPPRVDSQ